MNLVNTCSLSQTVMPFIEGAFVRSESSATMDAINPSTGQACVTIPEGCQADADRAVASARAAFDDGRWCDAPPSFRKRVLHRFADLIESNAAALDGLDAGEMGKPIAEKAGNAAAAARFMRFYAEAVDKVVGDVYGSDPSTFVAQRRVPRGVVAAVLPWNFPTLNAVGKIAPTLAAGNCMVVKPSELSSRSSVALAELAAQAELPRGVLNVVPGLGETMGRALGLHGHVDMMTFTGSTQVGKQMLHYSAQSNMKVVLAECGGKSPHMVFDDGVDLDAACQVIAQQLLTNQGQVCSMGSRLLVQRGIERKVIDKIVSRLGNIVIGDALDPKTTFGPIVSAKQCATVMRYIDGAEAEGAQLVVGGRRIMRETGGYFVEPTVYRNVKPDARIAQEEIFGPVLSVISFDHEAEAIRIANGTIYGLGAFVWTASLSTGLRVAKSIRSSVRINAAAPVGEGAGFAASHEPAGQSGVGTEGGLDGMESYLRRQRIWINHG